MALSILRCILLPVGLLFPRSVVLSMSIFNWLTRQERTGRSRGGFRIVGPPLRPPSGSAVDYLRICITSLGLHSRAILAVKYSVDSATPRYFGI